VTVDILRRRIKFSYYYYYYYYYLLSLPQAAEPQGSTEKASTA